MTNQKPNNYIDVLTSVVTKKKVTTEEVNKLFTGFKCIQWLSSNPMCCYAANQINSSRGITRIPPNAEYAFLRNSIKLKTNTRLPFNKDKKDLDFIINILAVHYKTGPITAEKYLNMMGGERAIEIANIYAHIGTTTTDSEVLEIRKEIKIAEKALKEIKGLK